MRWVDEVDKQKIEVQEKDDDAEEEYETCIFSNPGAYSPNIKVSKPPTFAFCSAKAGKRTPSSETARVAWVVLVQEGKKQVVVKGGVLRTHLKR